MATRCALPPIPIPALPIPTIILPALPSLPVISFVIPCPLD